ncbi:probable 60S ribosomal protein L14 [Hevea brasiliensis]|uniref:probable 60S ribosomal protein L14 n=1 Tax=Hevea brasiliensis TaxID=3981 RepID=UPI0025E470BB|nr:probable 60S ribosomal protein L14 [Hevea brasiliensis]
MLFKRYVEIGRGALVNYGKDYEKLVVTADVTDQNRALVGAPEMVKDKRSCQRKIKMAVMMKIDAEKTRPEHLMLAELEAAHRLMKNLMLSRYSIRTDRDQMERTDRKEIRRTIRD